MRHLPIPPPVNQITTPIPDGSQDTNWEADCGEANLSSIFQVVTGYRLAPGCIRESMGVADGNGTTGPELAEWLDACTNVRARVHDISDGYNAYHHLNPLRHGGRYVIALGNWDGLGLHWELNYRWYPNTVWVMNPNGGIYQLKSEQDWANQYRGTYVGVDFNG